MYVTAGAFSRKNAAFATAAMCSLSIPCNWFLISAYMTDMSLGGLKRNQVIIVPVWDRCRGRLDLEQKSSSCFQILVIFNFDNDNFVDEMFMKFSSSWKVHAKLKTFMKHELCSWSGNPECMHCCWSSCSHYWRDFRCFNLFGPRLIRLPRRDKPLSRDTGVRIWMWHAVRPLRKWIWCFYRLFSFSSLKVFNITVILYSTSGLQFTETL